MTGLAGGVVISPWDAVVPCGPICAGVRAGAAVVHTSECRAVDLPPIRATSTDSQLCSHTRYVEGRLPDLDRARNVRRLLGELVILNTRQLYGFGSPLILCAKQAAAAYVGVRFDRAARTIRLLTRARRWTYRRDHAAIRLASGASASSWRRYHRRHRWSCSVPHDR